jgi:hypothetical protein
VFPVSLSGLRFSDGAFQQAGGAPGEQDKDEGNEKLKKLRWTARSGGQQSAQGMQEHRNEPEREIHEEGFGGLVFVHGWFSGSAGWRE